MTDLVAIMQARAEHPIPGFNSGTVPQRSLDGAIAYLRSMGFRVRSFMMPDSDIPRYQVDGWTGSALACQVVGMARLKGWGL
ncbi:hypothetical protein [Sphingobium aromaticiconvertens]|uniref:hypothetical protein n=1 Tax=Sphingobium aromaticiconvertens TaxID=365341 RepID=UPI00301856A7